MIDNLQNPLTLKLSGGVWRKYFCLFASAHIWSSSIFVWLYWFTVLEVEGSQNPEVLCSIGHLVTRLVSCSPHSESEDLFIQLRLSQKNPNLMRFRSGFEKLQGVLQSKWREQLAFLPVLVPLGLVLLFPPPSAFPPWRRHLPWWRLPACFTDLVGVQN